MEDFIGLKIFYVKGFCGAGPGYIVLTDSDGR
jgi:hypothetical protein